MNNPGALKRRLAIEIPIDIPDGAGGAVRSYEDGGAVWASVTPMSARETTDAARLGIAVTHRITIRARSGLTNGHRLREGASIFRITALRDADGSGRYLEISAEQTH